MLIAAGAAVGLVSVEIALRLFAPQLGDCAIALQDDELGSVLRPSCETRCVTIGGTVSDVRTDARGFRLPGAGAPPAGGCRILVLGDSTTFGLGVDGEATVPALLASLMNRGAAGGARVEVINAGMPGYGTAQEWLTYRRWAGRLRPDLVLLLFLTTNDLDENACARGRTASCFEWSAAGLRPRKLDPQGEEAADEEGFHSHLLLFAKLRLQELLVRSPLLKRAVRRLVPDALAGDLPQTISSWYGAGFQGAWSLTTALLDALWRDTVANGTPLVIGILPSRPQTSPAYSQLIGIAFGDRPEARAFLAEPTRPQRLLREWAARHGLAAVDPLPQLRAAVASGRRINLPDGHFSAAGNAIIATALAGALDGCRPLIANH